MAFYGVKTPLVIVSAQDYNYYYESTRCFNCVDALVRRRRFYLGGPMVGGGGFGLILLILLVLFFTGGLSRR